MALREQTFKLIKQVVSWDRAGEEYITIYPTHYEWDFHKVVHVPVNPYGALGDLAIALMYHFQDETHWNGSLNPIWAELYQLFRIRQLYVVRGILMDDLLSVLFQYIGVDIPYIRVYVPTLRYYRIRETQPAVFNIDRASFIIKETMKTYRLLTTNSTTNSKTVQKKARRQSKIQVGTSARAQWQAKPKFTKKW